MMILNFKEMIDLETVELKNFIKGYIKNNCYNTEMEHNLKGVEFLPKNEQDLALFHSMKWLEKNVRINLKNDFSLFYLLISKYLYNKLIKKSTIYSEKENNFGENFHVVICEDIPSNKIIISSKKIPETQWEFGILTINDLKK